MKIAVNTRLLLSGKLEGIGVFTAETMRRITQAHPEHEFYFLFDRPYDKQFVFSSNVHPVVMGPPARHPVLWYWWFEWSVPRMLQQVAADLFVSPDGYASLRAQCPQVVVMHDLAYEHFDDHVDRLTRAYYRHFSPRYAQKAARIVAVSEYTRNDLMQLYGVEASRIDVVYNGVDAYFRPLAAEEKEQVRQHLTGGQPYFLYAGAIQPRKNIVRLLQAYDVYRSRYGGTLKLVMAGRQWSYPQAQRAFERMQFRADVIRIGHLSRAELARVMGAAQALVYVSLFEGFGIPIIEAMYSDVPVITSNTSSMPEVAGDAALLVNPLSVDAMAEAMHQIAGDAALCQRLIQAGRQRRQHFSWQQSAHRFWNSIEAVARAHGVAAGA